MGADLYWESRNAESAWGCRFPRFKKAIADALGMPCEIGRTSPSSEEGATDEEVIAELRRRLEVQATVDRDTLKMIVQRAVDNMFTDVTEYSRRVPRSDFVAVRDLVLDGGIFTTEEQKEYDHWWRWFDANLDHPTTKTDD